MGYWPTLGEKWLHSRIILEVNMSIPWRIWDYTSPNNKHVYIYISKKCTHGKSQSLWGYSDKYFLRLPEALFFRDVIIHIGTKTDPSTPRIQYMYLHKTIKLQPFMYCKHTIYWSYGGIQESLLSPEVLFSSWRLHRLCPYELWLILVSSSWEVDPLFLSTDINL